MTHTVTGIRLEQGSARTRGGVRLEFRWTGGMRKNLPRIALVHSLALDSSVWDEVVPKLSAQAEILGSTAGDMAVRSGRPAPTRSMLGDADLRAVLPGLRCPVRIIVGEEDYATLVTAAEQLAAAIPGASLQVLPGARHLTPIECPSAIAEAIGVLAASTARGTTGL
jgi:hypothetical protein